MSTGVGIPVASQLRKTCEPVTFQTSPGAVSITGPALDENDTKCHTKVISMSGRVRNSRTEFAQYSDGEIVIQTMTLLFLKE